MHRTLLLAIIAALLTIPAAGIAGTPSIERVDTAADTYGITANFDNLRLPLVIGQKPAVPRTKRSTAAVRAVAADPVPGEVRDWVGVDFAFRVFYRKGYTFRGLGDHVEIWVASERRTLFGFTATGTDFLDGDCRNGPRTTITDAQVDYLIEQFDNNIYPTESTVFSIPPDRDGSHTEVGPPFNPAGDGDNIVVLVDNVRDDNFYDFDNTQGFSYVTGFFSSRLNELFDRNIVTIDAFDWLHRTGANPPHEPAPDNNCTDAPARPFLYEGVFAREYAHLLEEYEDPDEVNWINDGLADWARALTGYVDPSTPVTQIGFDAAVQCFLGWLGTATPANPDPQDGGPENSLTVWGDQGDGESLCDFGAAYTLMEYLAGRYGQDFMTVLHRSDANGLAGLEEALTAIGDDRRTTPQELLHNWSLTVALDGLVDDGALLNGRIGDESLVTTPTLDATINWDTHDAYSTPGAPPNGADYVRLRDASGNYLRGSQIETLGFQGSSTAAGFTVYIVSTRTDPDRIRVEQVRLDDSLASTPFAFIGRYVDPRAEFVGAIVFHDDPSETNAQYAPYQLTVNSVVQPGGS